MEFCQSGNVGTLIVGPADDAENFQHELRGIIPRTFEYLFNHIARQRELVGHCKFVSFLSLQMNAFFCQ